MASERRSGWVLRPRRGGDTTLNGYVFTDKQHRDDWMAHARADHYSARLEPLSRCRLCGLTNARSGPKTCGCQIRRGE